MTSSTLRGSTAPRIWTKPLAAGPPGPCGCGCALTPATSLGYELVGFVEGVVGAKLLPWQRWLAIHAFETVVRDGRRRFRYRTVLILIARQNGKTTFVELKNLWKMYVRQVPLIIGTAQKLDLAEESWGKAVDIAESVPELAAEIAQVNKTNGKKALVLTNGSRWKIEPAVRGGGRGLSGDDVNLDELREHQNWLSWGAVTKTTMARANAQVFAFTNAGDDKSIVLNELQEQYRRIAKALDELLATDPADIMAALDAEGLDASAGLFEWTVPDDVVCTCRRKPHMHDCRLQDRGLWAMANPSLGYVVGDFGLTEAAIASALATDPTPIFLTEVLCQRVPDLSGQKIDAERWAELADVDAQAGADITFCLELDVSGERATISGYSTGPDPRFGHLELTDHDLPTRQAAARLATLKERYNPVALVLDARGPAVELLTALAEFGIRPQKVREVDDRDAPNGKREVWDRGGLYVPTLQDVTAAAPQFVTAVRDGTFRHIGQLPHEVAVPAAKPRTVGDAWAWGRRLASINIAPVVASTNARYVHVKLLGKLPADDDYDILASVY